MTREDERILEMLRSDGWATPSMLSREAFQAVSEGHVRERLEFLRYAGLVHSVHGSMFEITSEGLMYLRGDLDASHLPTPTVDRCLGQ
ncbi:hypothetical protein [Halosimplex marinum]|uniref:hypothetical protein n=1 Tax=Halosimplex marinum TaxID=3396620 RepID=UPI003F55D3A5